MACTRFVSPKYMGKQSFLYVKEYHNIIYIAIKFHYDIPKGFLINICAKLFS